MTRQRRICQCGKWFYVTPQQATKIHCSVKCYDKHRRSKGIRGQGVAHYTVIDGPCSFCHVNGQQHTTGAEICRECLQVSLWHEAANGDRIIEAGMVTWLYAEAERIRLARSFQPHPVGYPPLPAEVLEFHDGARQGRY